MIDLPEEYCDSMRKLLGEKDYELYIKSFEKKSVSAIRINTMKISVDKWREMSPFSLEPIPWIEKGFILNEEDRQLASRHPYYFAGLYYIQEPSAMIPASILPIEKGDKVLDLCAAPGGKATEIAAKLDGTGVLVANDISVSRAMALAKNLQVTGTKNALVTAEIPENLEMKFRGFFDKIIIDAPCSGEGMFRREPRMVKDWLEKGPEFYQKIQRQILESAYSMLAPGGKMVYSTCTFSVMEDEENIDWFIKNHSDIHICDVEQKEGFSEGRPDMVEGGSSELSKCIRIFPHKADGEGHFAVLLGKDTLDKNEEAEDIVTDVKTSLKNAKKSKSKKTVKKQKSSKPAENISPQEALAKFIDIKEAGYEDYDIVSRNAQVMLVPHETNKISGIRIIQNGTIAGEIKREFEPSCQFALVMKNGGYKNVLDFKADDINVIKYLKGETLNIDTELKGWILITVDGYPLGWCKGNGKGLLKNKYYAGWRLQ